jgi:hypothetical protein
MVVVFVGGVNMVVTSILATIPLMIKNIMVLQSKEFLVVCVLTRPPEEERHSLVVT